MRPSHKNLGQVAAAVAADVSAVVAAVAIAVVAVVSNPALHVLAEEGALRLKRPFML